MNIAIQIALGLVCLAIFMSGVIYLADQLPPAPDWKADAEEALQQLSLRNFAQRHPGKVRRGVVRCPQCDGSRQVLRRAHHGFLRAHDCRTCGRFLYYTEA